MCMHVVVTLTVCCMPEELPWCCGHTSCRRPLYSYTNLSSFLQIEDSGYVSLINVNGSVNISDIATLLALTPYAPQDFPLNTSNTILFGIDWGAVVAPYWYDADTRGNGSGRIYYKDVTRGSDPDLTEVIDTLATPYLCGFNTIWALIVTWDHVGYFPVLADKVRICTRPHDGRTRACMAMGQC